MFYVFLHSLLEMKENFRTLFTGKLREKKLYPRDVIIKGSPLMAVDMEGESRKI
jgi:hypothetical protein